MDTSRCSFLHDGVIYYSPNCDRHVIVPPRTDPSQYRFTKDNACLNRFQHPQWWTRPYGFLAFVPLIPRFDGTVFGCLRDITAHICPCEHDGKFSLRPEKLRNGGFIDPCCISAEEEYALLIRPFLFSSPPFMPWIPPSSRYSSRCPSSSCHRTRLVCCLDGSAFIPPWTLQR